MRPGIGHAGLREQHEHAEGDILPPAKTSLTASIADGESPVAVGMKQTRFFPSPAARLTAYSRNAGSRFSSGARFRTPEKANTCLGLTGICTA